MVGLALFIIIIGTPDAWAIIMQSDWKWLLLATLLVSLLREVRGMVGESRRCDV